MGKYFGTDGVRGEANKDLTAEMAYHIGCYLGNYYANKGKGKILIGKDTRLSSDMFEAALSAGLNQEGSDAYLIGFTTTPCLAYLVAHEDFDCGIMISASHNPYYDNGIKIFGTDGLKIKDDLELPIEDYMDNKFTIEKAGSANIGRIFNYSEGIKHYLDWLCSIFPLDLSNFNILLDLANGGACYTAEVFERLKAKVHYLNNEPNGLNINLNCGSTHLENIQNKILEDKYDIGFAFDGDADRVLAINQKGEIIDGDKIIYLLANNLKKKNMLRNNHIVATVMSNIGLKKALASSNIDYEIVAVGDKNVVDAMRKNDYLIGGEQSGHIINALNGYFGDGIKTALNILKVMIEEKKNIDELTKDVYIYPQELINIKVKDKNIVLQDRDIRNLIAEIEKELADNGRILVRASGTEPLIRIMSEAKDLDTCHTINQKIIELIYLKDYNSN